MLNLNTIPLDDTKTWDLICDGHTKGVFQIETPLGAMWAKRIKPRSIDELAALTALIRPGCLEAIVDGANMVEHYRRRKFYEEEVPTLHPLVDEVLAPTYGVFLFQEQILEIARKVAGFSLSQADSLRKSLGKKLADEMAKCRTLFLDGIAQEKIVSESLGNTLWDQIEKSQRYLFNKSHSIGYGLLSYKTAYLKANYPLEFITALLRHAKDKNSSRFKIVGEVIRSAKFFNIEVRTPDLRKLNENFFIEQNDIRFGISNIRGIGGAVYHELVNKIQGFIEQFGCIDKWSWYIFLIKIAPNLRSIVVEGLINSGAIDFMGQSRASMLYEYRKYVNDTTDTEKKWFVEHFDRYDNFLDLLKGSAALRKNGGAACRTTRLAHLEELISTIEHPPYRLEDNPGQIAYLEQDLLGAAITYDITETKNTFSVNTTVKEFLNGKGGFLTLGVQLVRVGVWKTRNGKSPGREMAFLTVADKTGEMGDVVVFPDVFKECRSMLTEDAVVILNGERKKQKDKESFIVTNIQIAT